MGDKYQAVKSNIGKPKISQMQLILFALIALWATISKLSAFKRLSMEWQIGFEFVYYIAIMLTANMKGSLVATVRQFIQIVGGKGTSDEKVVKLQNLLVAIAQELGLYYEKEIAKINGRKEELTKAELESKIAELEKK